MSESLGLLNFLHKMNTIWKMVLMAMVLISNIGVKAGAKKAVADTGTIPEEYSGPIVNNRPNEVSHNNKLCLPAIVKDHMILTIIISSILVIFIVFCIVYKCKCSKKYEGYARKTLNTYDSDANETDIEQFPLNYK
eukprot:110647_1